MVGVIVLLEAERRRGASSCYFRSPLGATVFNDALLTLNPTRHWGIPNVPPQRRR